MIPGKKLRFFLGHALRPRWTDGAHSFQGSMRLCIKFRPDRFRIAGVIHKKNSFLTNAMKKLQEAELSWLLHTITNATDLPVNPAGPDNPVDPITPSSPGSPTGPGDPVAPACPVSPVIPMTPWLPVTPVSPC